MDEDTWAGVSDEIKITGDGQCTSDAVLSTAHTDSDHGIGIEKRVHLRGAGDSTQDSRRRDGQAFAERR